MITTRHGIFETNSSSSHSITTNGIGILGTMYGDSNGILYITPGEFGWGYEEHNDPYTKASYALTWAKMNEDIKAGKMLKQVLLKQTHAKEIMFKSEDEDWGYIDHQSAHLMREYFEDEEKLRLFIFNPLTTLIIDNDNH